MAASDPIVWADVVAIASHFAIIETDAQTIILDFVNGFLNPKMFTDVNLRTARIYLAAHVASYSMPGVSGIGTVLSETVGGLTRTYAVLSTIRLGSIDGTIYASMYNNILNSSRARWPRVF